MITQKRQTLHSYYYIHSPAIATLYTEWVLLSNKLPWLWLHAECSIQSDHFSVDHWVLYDTLHHVSELVRAAQSLGEGDGERQLLTNRVRKTSQKRGLEEPCGESQKEEGRRGREFSECKILSLFLSLPLSPPPPPPSLSLSLSLSVSPFPPPPPPPPSLSLPSSSPPPPPPPGAMVHTLMPCLAKSRAMGSVMATIAPLLAE